MSKLKLSSLLAAIGFALIAVIALSNLFTGYIINAWQVSTVLLHSVANACIAYFFFMLYKNQK